MSSGYASEENTGGGNNSTIELFTPFEETVETVEDPSDEKSVPTATLNYSNLIYLPSIKVTFDGVEYICKGANFNNSAMIYGGWPGDEDPFADYPFIISSTGNSNILTTKTAGTYAVRIEPSDESVELADVIANGQSVNAALMRLVLAFRVFPDLSDSNAKLIDKIGKAVSGGQGVPTVPGINS